MNYTDIDFLKTSTYNYDLPQELIAQEPSNPRDSSRLLLLDRASTKIHHEIFHNIVDYLRPGDLLIMNDTRVFPARVIGKKKKSGGAVEIFFLYPKKNESHIWVALVKPGRRLPPETIVTLDNNVEVLIGDKLEDGLRYVVFSDDLKPFELIHKYGTMPLPHYITNTNFSPERYQTVYCNQEKENSVAAPTAGLHFTEVLLDKIRQKGIDVSFITLEVGLGTFRPVKAENIKDHIMHSEFCELSQETIDKINKTKESNGRVIAVGTTVVRTLESFAKKSMPLEKGAIDTKLFIYPGYKFKVIDALITNFHLPESTLLMLVSAFAGYEFTIDSYKKAVENKYRFFSFGDSMFIY
ncbi:MAG: tRNA preQ1(34) S-adenosylmethionine ribosyltransferase-isomerase QueA [Synergistaceae bacterium]